MKTILAVLLATALAACASHDRPAAEDAFTQIARSWEGAAIEDMIRTWGAPRILEQEDAKGGAGFATWSRMTGGTFLPANSSTQATTGSASRCEATAHFDTAGIIERVDVASRRCSEARESLRRP